MIRSSLLLMCSMLPTISAERVDEDPAPSATPAALPSILRKLDSSPHGEPETGKQRRVQWKHPRPDVWEMLDADQRANLDGRFLCASEEMTKGQDAVRVAVKSKLEKDLTKLLRNTKSSLQDSGVGYKVWVKLDMRDDDSNLAKQLSWTDTCSTNALTEEYFQMVFERWKVKGMEKLQGALDAIVRNLHDGWAPDPMADRQPLVERKVTGWMKQVRRLLVTNKLFNPESPPVYFTATLAKIFTSKMVKFMLKLLGSPGLFDRFKASGEERAKKLVREELNRRLHLDLDPVAACPPATFSRPLCL